MAEVVHLATGDVINGAITSENDDAMTIKAAFGDVTIKKSLVEKVEHNNRSGNPQHTAPQAKAESAPSKPVRDWTGRVDFATNLSRGNTDSDLYHLQGRWEKQRNQHRYKADLTLIREERDGNEVKEQDRADFGYHYLMTDKWFIALNGKYYSDPFAFVDRRYSISPAIGRDIWADSNKSLNIQLGAGYNREENNIETETSATLDWRLDFSYRFTALPVEAFHSHNATKLLDESKSLIIHSQTGLSYSISKDLSLKIQLDHNYDSEPAGNAEKDDLTFVIGAGLVL